MLPETLKLNMDRLTIGKATSISEINEYEATGFVMRDKNGHVCVVEKSAVRWIENEEWWDIMHPAIDAVHEQNKRTLTKIAKSFIDEGGTELHLLEMALVDAGIGIPEANQIITNAHGESLRGL